MASTSVTNNITLAYRVMGYQKIRKTG